MSTTTVSPQFCIRRTAASHTVSLVEAGATVTHDLWPVPWDGLGAVAAYIAKAKGYREWRDKPFKSLRKANSKRSAKVSA